jgi:hypothetical protein
MNLPLELSIPAKDWDRTPLSVQGVLLALWQENQAFKQQMDGLQAELEKLGERVNKNSRNSSKPPSSDPPQTRSYPKREPTGQKKGGKKGHHGRGRKLKPPEEVSRVVVSKPTVCAGCGELLLGADPQPERHQVSELPRIEPEIVEYQRHTLSCCVCGTRNRAEWPAEMPRGSFGAGLQALIGSLGGRFGVSQRDIAEMLQSIFHVEISLGSIPAQERCVSQALEEAVQEAQAHVQQQAAVNLDETSWHELTRNFWL